MKKKDGFLKNLIKEINHAGLNTVKERSENKTFVLSPHPFLLTDLSGWIGALIVRAILYELGINEHHIFKWRPENKYVQYLILNHYAPLCMPQTLSLTAILESDDWVAKIRRLMRYDYFIKATLGFGSGAKRNYDKTTDFDQILQNHIKDDSFQNEKWVVQKRLKLDKEFRIHTFGKEILYGLTLGISGSSEINDFDAPQEFIHKILERLPFSFSEGTLIGWDVALTSNGKYYVIEANFTGFHPVDHAGFQTTGYVDTAPFGPIMCALLYTYFKNKYGIFISSVENTLIEKFSYLEEFCYYISIFKVEHIQSLFKTKGRVKAMYIHLDEKTEFYIMNFNVYIQVANFADTIYIITNHKLREEAEKRFKGDRIIHLAERSLFTEDEYNKFQEFDYEIKKKKCHDQMMKLAGDQSYIIV